MSYTVEQRLLNMRPYEPQTGTFRIRADANESYLSIPAAARQEFCRVLAELEFNRYPDPYASKLCSAFSEYHGIKPELVTAGNGSDELINVICQSVLRDNAKMVCIEPDFSMYAFYSNLRRAQVCTVSRTSDYGVDIDAVLEMVKSERADLLIFSNPNNPTSQVLSKAEVLRLVENAPCLVVVDEAYMDFCDQSVVGEVENYQNLIVLRTMSKAFACAALRLGFAVTNATLSNILKAVKSPYNVNAASQAFGEVLLKYKKEADSAIAQIKNSRDELFGELSKITQVLGAPFKAVKPFANFVYIETPKADGIHANLMQEGVAVRRFENRLRITASSPADNSEIIKVLKSYK